MMSNSRGYLRRVREDGVKHEASLIRDDKTGACTKSSAYSMITDRIHSSSHFSIQC